jgi:hypothetical protein
MHFCDYDHYSLYLAWKCIRVSVLSCTLNYWWEIFIEYLNVLSRYFLEGTKDCRRILSQNSHESSPKFYPSVYKIKVRNFTT